MDIDHHVGVLESHARSLVGSIAVLEPIDYRILDTVGDIA